MSELVLVEKSCPGCGKQMSTEIERDDFFDSAVKIYKTAACWACHEYQSRLMKVAKLKTETWLHLRKAEVKHKSYSRKAENSSRYGSQSEASHQASELMNQVTELRGQLETLDKKEQALLDECQEYKTEQKGKPHGHNKTEI